MNTENTKKVVACVVAGTTLLTSAGCTNKDQIDARSTECEQAYAKAAGAPAPKGCEEIFEKLAAKEGGLTD